MATASVSNTPECCICFDSLDTPKILPCGHTFCLDCITIYISDKTETFPCPTCQRDIKIPEGGATEFTTNYIVKNNQLKKQPEPPPTRQTKCPNHKQREVDYYCNNCNVGLCLKCIFKQHKEHETLDIECDKTRNEAIEKLQRSQNIIQNRIKSLEKTRSTLLESFEQLKSLCEDSCAKVTEKTEQIVSELRKSCKQIIKDIRNNLEENRSKVEDREMELTSEINLLESNMESIISPSTETTLNILLTLPRLIEMENLDDRKDYNPCIQYLQWVRKDFILDIDQLGSVISKPFYIPGSYQFLCDIINVVETVDKNEKDHSKYFSKDKFRNNNLVWSCVVVRSHDQMGICIKLLSDDNPELDPCIIDGQLNLLNIDDDSKTLTTTVSKERLVNHVFWENPITWSKLTDKNNGYLNSNGQFVIQFDITQIRKISWK